MYLAGSLCLLGALLRYHTTQLRIHAAELGFRDCLVIDKLDDALEDRSAARLDKK